MNILNKLEYVNQAEEIIKKLPTNGKKGDFSLKTNQIRNILSLVNELYDMIRLNTNEKLDSEVQSHIQYIKIKIIYLAGRESSVKDFLGKSKIIEYLDSVKDSRDKLMTVCHYMEALVAYHKFYTTEL